MANHTTTDQTLGAAPPVGRDPTTSLRLLAVIPHPDDETYAMAGTLAAAAQRGARCQVCCVTRGEGGGDPNVRLGELERACALLGVAPPLVLDWPDGGLAELPVEPALARLRALLQQARPDVVLGLGADGAYGHSDHLALHRLLRLTVFGLEPVDRPQLFEAVFPPGHFHRFWRALRRAGFKSVPKGWGPERFGAVTADVVLPIAGFAELKLAAIAAHVSQLNGRAPADFLMPGLMQPLLEEERWHHVTWADGVSS
ncbi:MAG: PIG-L family deacetylase [Myxococcales bacterium]|nr:PIG-L family deacetylase [Myxococcales bacterium]